MSETSPSEHYELPIELAFKVANALYNGTLAEALYPDKFDELRDFLGTISDARPTYNEILIRFFVIDKVSRESFNDPDMVGWFAAHYNLEFAGNAVGLHCQNIIFNAPDQKLDASQLAELANLPHFDIGIEDIDWLSLFANTPAR